MFSFFSMNMREARLITFLSLRPGLEGEVELLHRFDKGELRLSHLRLDRCSLSSFQFLLEKGDEVLLVREIVFAALSVISSYTARTAFSFNAGEVHPGAVSPHS